MATRQKSKNKKTETVASGNGKAQVSSLYDELVQAPEGSGSGLGGANFWKPTEKGQHIEGEIADIAEGRFNDDVITIRQDDDELIKFSVTRTNDEGVPRPQHVDLFSRLKIGVGGRLCLIYDGFVLNPKTGRRFKTWRAAFKSAAEIEALQADDIPY